MGILHWIKQAFSSGVHKVEDLVGLIRSGLSGLWHVLTGLGHNVTKAWRQFGQAVEYVAGYLEGLALSVYQRLRHILTVVIPHAVAGAISTAARFAQRLANSVESWARGALRWLQDHLVGLLNDLRQWATAAVHWLESHLAQVTSDLARTMRRVWSLLDDPAHLAEWAIGAILSAALAWAEANAVRLGRWFARNAVHTVLDEAPTIEDWLSRII